MKKLISFITTAALVSCSGAVLTAGAAEQDTKVLVTVSDGKSASPVLIQKEVNVTDIDSDGKLTINDALYIAHEDNFTGGAAAGYKSSESTYGLMLNKLWGIENGGNYGYYVDNTAAMSLGDEVKDGSSIYAFVYSDTAKFSDSYSWFDKSNAEAKQGDELELTLSHIVYDANWTPSAVPVEGAVITVNGKATEFKTDASGKVKVKLDESGEDILISASSENLTLVPPVLVADVTANTAVTASVSETAAETTTESTTSAATASVSKIAVVLHENFGEDTTTSAPKVSAVSGSPATGDKGSSTAVIAFIAAGCTAFALRRKNEK
ncbi:hypothetical protein [Ruminococcus sp. HUN007]|uniref:hypothetical protein n=1 Tax=Ruminococcus sp. HUN007 TaxID=1514668 RepID=UPI0005D22499|nr:hypothetical protein [Ruminococcus sp. HUN007]